MAPKYQNWIDGCEWAIFYDSLILIYIYNIHIYIFNGLTSLLSEYIPVPRFGMGD